MEIYKARVKLFQYLYSNIDKPLNHQRYDKYNKLMAKGATAKLVLQENVA